MKLNLKHTSKTYKMKQLIILAIYSCQCSTCNYYYFKNFYYLKKIFLKKEIIIIFTWTAICSEVCFMSSDNYLYPLQKMLAASDTRCIRMCVCRQTTKFRMNKEPNAYE